MSLLVVLIIVVLILGGGGFAWYGPGRTAPGYAPYSLGGIILLLLLVWLFFGHSFVG
jgi:hypothetical protein